MKMNSLDRAAVPVALLLIITLGVVLFINQIVGAQATLFSNRPGLLGPLILTFNIPVEAGALDGLAHFQPELPGSWQSLSERQVQFIPAAPLQETEYSLRLDSGIVGPGGEKIKFTQEFQFQPRSLAVIYLRTDTPDGNLWIVEMGDSTARQITFIKGKVFDFAVDRFGEQVAYSIYNDAGGSDIWLTDRGGNNQNLVLNCGSDLCSEPFFSPEGKQLVYSRQTSGVNPGTTTGAPRPWTVNFKTRQTAPVFSDAQVVGVNPSWSPDGKQIVIYDSVQGEFHLKGLETGIESVFESKVQQFLGWSADGSKALFVDKEGDAFVIRQMDFSQDQAETLLKNQDVTLTYLAPAWSPTGEQFAVGFYGDGNASSSQINLFSLAALTPVTLPGETGFFDAEYSWEPLGKSLLFQRLAAEKWLQYVHFSTIGAFPDFQPNVYIYDTRSGKTTLVAKDALLPRWMP